MYTTLQDVDTSNTGSTKTISDALLWTISQVQRNISIPMTLSPSLVAPNTEVYYSGFNLTILRSFLGILEPEAPILKYPIEGFAILVKAFENMGGSELDYVHNALFHRIFFHLMEQNQAFLSAENRPAAVPILIEDLLAPTAGVEDSSNGGMPITGNTSSQHKHSSISVSSLCGGPLLSQEALATFRRMGSCFSRFENSSA